MKEKELKEMFNRVVKYPNIKSPSPRTIAQMNVMVDLSLYIADLIENEYRKHPAYFCLLDIACFFADHFPPVKRIYGLLLKVIGKTGMII